MGDHQRPFVFSPSPRPRDIPNTKMRSFSLALLAKLGLAQYDPQFAPGHAGIVHLFEWHWDTIADECERFLGPMKVGGVQISPPNENRVITNRPWWERYQPISYKLETRSGNRQQLQDMINRCNAVGVRIYPDAVINHMCGAGGSGTGTGGTSFNANSESFPGVPYSSYDFNDANCHSSSGDIENYQDPNQVRNCRLVSLLDLNQGTSYVRGKIMDYMNDLISMGVAGFRVDACKHMWPGDLEYIFGNLNQVNSDVGSGLPYIFQEVIDQGGEPITASQYFGAGSVTEFKYGLKIGDNIGHLSYFSNFGESWGLMSSKYALAFISNHDNQRGHGGGGNLITFQHNAYDFKVASAFMNAWPYGVARTMSSYYFDDSDQGPPGSQRSVSSDFAESCGNGWVCEHRWKAIAASFGFRAAVAGTSMNDWWDNGQNQIAFGRGSKGWIAINKDSYTMTGTFQTGLAPGTYKDAVNGGTYTVDSSRKVYVSLSNKDDHNIIMLYDGASSPSPVNPDDGTCSVSNKVDCGYLGIDQSECQSTGCCWAESSVQGEPWCFQKET